MNLSYLIPRLVRHFMPEALTRFLLLRGWIIKASVETVNPQGAVQRYVDVLASHGYTLEGKRVMVFGYGGRFDIGVGLLEAGAKYVILCDKYAPPDHVHNLSLLPLYARYLVREGETVKPRPEHLTLLQADIRTVADMELVDIILSNSVYEHLDDVEGITHALAALTKPEGIQVHFVDLRDHYFKYPFEMLRFSESVWRNWLNPTSNHNRYRLWDYRRVFEANFNLFEIEVLARQEAAFRDLAPCIRPEFKSGDLADDSVTLIRVVVAKPKQNEDVPVS